MDWMVQEKERGITITSAATTCQWLDCKINLIDTPGHVDFTAEVERSLRVLDGAVAVFDAGEGVEPQSETVWRQADKYNVPRLALSNKMDKVGADFYMCVTSMDKKLGVKATPIQIPIGAEDTFVGVIDLVVEKAYTWDGEEKGQNYKEMEIPADMKDRVTELRMQMIENVCEGEGNEAILEKYLEGAELSIDEIKKGIRKLTVTGKMYPVLCGSALKKRVCSCC
jgi:elongation factor G